MTEKKKTTTDHLINRATGIVHLSQDIVFHGGKCLIVDRRKLQIKSSQPEP
jgi:hypothetical protein